MSITIFIDQQGLRLDKFLVAYLKDRSRSEIQKMIKFKIITVNDKSVAPHYFLKAGDKVKIVEREIKTDKKIKAPKIIKQKIPKLKIVKETDDYLVIDKPAGIMVHPSEEGQDEKTLVDVLLKDFPQIAKIGEDPMRPGIVHRLDKEVSGLMIIAKSQSFFDYIKEQFQERKVKKIYTALAHGQIEADSDLINFPIKRSGSGYKMSALPYTVKGEKNPEGKTAITEFEVLKRFINFTLLEVKIKTGRTHQIRAHLAAYGHPLVGDKLYGTPKTKTKDKKFDLDRIFLAATELSFFDLQDKKQEFKIKIPNNLNETLKKLK